jgi:hypothetical protein
MGPGLGLLLVLGLATACVPSGATVSAEAAQAQARAEKAQSALDEAVAAYHEDGAIEGLVAWVETHPEHPDRDVWREVVALRSYEALVIGDPWTAEEAQDGEDAAVAPLPEPTATELVALVERYPGTLGADTAQALLESDGLRRLSMPAFNDSVVSFLEGRDDWVRDDYGRNLMPNVDLDAFRERHEDSLRMRLAQRLAEDGCVGSMGYCTWYVQRYPDDPRAGQLQVAMKDEWYRRGHPRWRGSKFANCAYRCAKNCRTNAEPLDDACYAPCFARCEASAPD